MRRISHLLLLLTFLLSSCLPDVADMIPIPVPTSSSQAVLFVYRFELPAFVGFSRDLQITQETPFSYPVNCGLYDTFPAPVGQVMAVELSCPNGQSVLFMDLETGALTLPFTSTDSHFLAWQSDGQAAYVKVDSLSNPQIIRAFMGGDKDILPISEFTYDLAAKPDSSDFIFTLSRGFGNGSELYSTQYEARNTQLLYADQNNYLSFARFSPDGKQIAFITIPDSQIPFTVGELWVMDADGSNAHKLADADAGHGYAANWSPDGTKIAFVVRENPEDVNADRSSDALISNIYVVDVASGESNQITNFTEGRGETPHWSPYGNTLAFNVVINGRMTVSIVDVATGKITPLVTDIAPVGGSACCPAWMRK